MNESKKPRKRNYINNPDLLKALIDYKELCVQAESKGEQKPQVPEYIAKAFWLISERIAMKPNYAGYPFKEDMILDAVETCLKYMHNFSPEKQAVPNPFAYFTRFVLNAFHTRIAKEQKELYVKFKSAHHLLMFDGTYSGIAGEHINLTVSNEYMDDFVKNYEEKLQRSKDKKAAKLLDKDSIID